MHKIHYLGHIYSDPNRIEDIGANDERFNYHNRWE
jgi:hypothetical protein